MTTFGHMRNVAFCTLMATLLFGCQPTAAPESTENPAKEIATAAFAKGFLIEPIEGGYSVQFANSALRDLAPTRFLRSEKRQNTDIGIPLQRIACLSTTHASYLADLGLADRIVGIGYADAVLDSRLKALIDEGKIQNITNATGLDLEKLVSLQPEAFLVYTYDFTPNAMIEKAGISIIHINEYEEQHPLARAEWLKLFGVIGDCLPRADSLFNQLYKEYDRLRQSVFISSRAPFVVTASYYGGQWYVPGSESFAAQLIQDAGGAYLFHHKEGEGNVPVSFEELYVAASQADFFGKVASAESDLHSSFFEGDKRLENLPCFKENRLFLCNTRTADYFGKASTEPHVLLADLIKIFHPALLPEYEGVYFKPTQP